MTVVRINIEDVSGSFCFIVKLNIAGIWLRYVIYKVDTVLYNVKSPERLYTYSHKCC